MNCIILGAQSEIGLELCVRLHVDGWTVFGWARGERVDTLPEWSLLVSCIGTVAPVGWWYEQDADAWEDSVRSNLFTPLRLLRELWPRRTKDAAVCFMAGSNPNTAMPGYSAYNAGKMALLKLTEQLDAESPDCKFFALGPGYIPTKIHAPTLDAKWPNPRIMSGKPPATHDQVYACLKWCLAQPRSIVGGRNVCASDPYTRIHDWQPDTFKLRRKEQ